MRKLLFMLVTIFIAGNTECQATQESKPLGCHPPLMVAGSPQSQTVCPGKMATFTSFATFPLFLVWQLSTDNGLTWENIPNSDRNFGCHPRDSYIDSLVIPNITLSLNNYQYRCSYGGWDRTSYSGAATLTVAVIETDILKEPAGIYTCVGTTAQFTVVASGSSLSYQWQVNNGNDFINITRATLPYYKIDTVTYDLNNNQYRCIINSECAMSKTTQPAILTVNPIPTQITEQPKRTFACAGNNVSFSALATGDDIHYHWQIRNDSNYTYSDLPAAISPTLDLPFSLENNAIHYRCKITSACTTVYTDDCLVNYITGAPYILDQPTVQQAACKTGDSIRLFVSAFAVYDTVSLQWQKSIDHGNRFSDIPAATGYYYELAYNSPADTAHLYRCKISGNCFFQYSDSIKVFHAIGLPVSIIKQPVTAIAPISSPANFNIATTGSSRYYEWEVSKDSGKSFNYFDSYNNPSLTFYDVNKSQDGNLFRCKVIDACGNISYSAAAGLRVSISWIGNSSTNWNDPANWSDELIPTSNSDIYIPAGRPNYPELSTTVTCRSIYLSSDARMKINTVGNIIITGN